MRPARPADPADPLPAESDRPDRSGRRFGGRIVTARRRAAGLRAARQVAAVLVLGACASVGTEVLGQAARGQAVRGQAADEASTYRLAATWSDHPWQLRAGAFARVVDVALAPGGDRLVLDGQQSALHRLRPDGTPVSVWSLGEHGVAPSDGWLPQRLAVRHGTGDIALLCVRETDGGQRRSLVVVLAPSGAVAHRFETDGAYRDVGLLRDGRVVLARTRPRVPPTPVRGPVPRLPGGLDVFTAGGVLSDVIERPVLHLPMALDVAPNGDVHVVNWLPLPGGTDPGPEPTQRPSVSRARPAQAGEPSAVEGVVTFDAAFVWRRTTPFDAADDVAVGERVFVSRQADVFALGDLEPIWTAPAGALSLPYFGRQLALTAGPDRTLVAALAHCSFQGIVDLSAAPGGPPPALHGSLDRPALAGPLAPIRIAADRDLDVLQGRFDAVSGPGRAPVSYGRAGAEPQSILRLGDHGAPIRQVGVCGDDQVWFETPSDARWAIDLASRRDWVFEGAPELVTASRVGASGSLPAWQLWLGAIEPKVPVAPSAAPSTPHLAALDAHADRLAILDVGRSSVLLVDLDRAAAATDDVASAAIGWSTESLLGNLPVDIALGDDVAYLADAGGRRIVVADLTGRLVHGFAVHDTPMALAVAHAPSAGQDVFVLGRHGWGLRYAPDGRLAARWRLPLPSAATDIAVLPDGRVAVSFLRDAPPAPGDAPEGRRIVQGGVWVFAPDPIEPAIASPPTACLIATDKRAAPAVVRRGEAVTVTLTAGGTCPARRSETDVVLAVDTSRSMSWDGAVERARKAVIGVLAALDGRSVRVALVTYADDGRVVEPLTADLSRIARAVTALSAGGDTRMAGALAAADQIVRDSNAARTVVLIVTDGELKDYPQTAARALADRGVALYALAVPLRSYTFQHTRALAGLVGDGHVFVDPDAAGSAVLAGVIAAEAPAPHLLAQAVVTDTLPADMTFIEGSARPPAAWDDRERRLTWHLSVVPLTATVQLRYAVRPTTSGLRRTNVAARVTGQDGTGWGQDLAFPVPMVKVWDRASLSRRAYLPIGFAGACVRPPPGDVVLVLDASRSMDEAALPGTGTKLDVAKAAVRRFAARLAGSGARAGLVAFSEEARVHVHLTADEADIARGVAEVTAAPGTRIDRALVAADRLLADEARSDAFRAVVLLTDGRASAPASDVTAAADALTGRGSALYAIALGDDADLALLGRIVRPESGLVRAVDAAAIDGAFDAVFEALRCRR